jgi:hypothetical protein
LTLRDNAGEGLVTAMLPPGGGDDPEFKIVIVGKGNRDPYENGGDKLVHESDRIFPVVRAA